MHVFHNLHHLYADTTNNADLPAGWCCKLLNKPSVCCLENLCVLLAYILVGLDDWCCCCCCCRRSTMKMGTRSGSHWPSE